MEVLTKEEMNALKGGGGQLIADPLRLVEIFKKKLIEEISSYEKMLLFIKDNEEISFMQRGIEERKSTLKEIETLEKSRNLYHFGSSRGSTGETYYSNGIVFGGVPIGSEIDYGLIGHELKHMYQYEMAQIIRGNEKTTYDIDDELEAYHRQGAIDNIFYYGSEALQYTTDKIKAMKDENGKPLYNF